MKFCFINNKYSLYKIFFCYTFSFLSLHFSFSQQNEFAPIGAKWWYSIPCWEWNPDCGYCTFESKKDTFILGQNAKVIEYAINGMVVPEATQIMYGDSDRIYYYMNDNFYMLYDFGANPGDTLNIKLGPHYFTFDTVGYYSQVVDSVGWVEIDSQLVRKIYSRSLFFYDTNYTGATWWYFGEVIETIANTGHLFGSSVYLPFDMTIFWIRCYQDSAINYKYYTYYKACDYISSIEKINNNSDFKIYPNPVNEYLFIKNLFPHINNAIYGIIYDLLGNKILEFKITDNTIPINFSQIQSGVYLLKILKITDNKSDEFFTKLIKA